jgi:hypothetical protein
VRAVLVAVGVADAVAVGVGVAAMCGRPTLVVWPASIVTLIDGIAGT